MNWIAIAFGVWLVWTLFFLAVWVFAFRAGRERGRIEGGQLGYQQGRIDERRDQAFEPILENHATLGAVVEATSGLRR